MIARCALQQEGPHSEPDPSGIFPCLVSCGICCSIILADLGGSLKWEQSRYCSAPNLERFLADSSTNLNQRLKEHRDQDRWGFCEFFCPVGRSGRTDNPRRTGSGAAEGYAARHIQ